MKEKHAGLWAAAVVIGALPVLLIPIGDPDLWWHLSSAQWMFQHGAWPRADWLSFSLPGEPWADFEWLAQLVFQAFYWIGGAAGLWLLKISLLVLAGSAVYAAGSGRRMPAPARAAAVGVWAAAMVPRADIRTELFSLAAFAWLLFALERWRAKPGPRGGDWRAPVVSFAYFALWANLHVGFAYGLLLLGFYAAAEWLEERRSRTLGRCLAAAVAGSMFNPYGWEVYGVLFRHGAEARELAEYIVEWKPLSLLRRGHWPSWVLLGAAIALLAARRRKGGRFPILTAATLAVFAAAGLKHARLAAYFATAAVMLMGPTAFSWRLLPESEKRLRESAAAVLVLSTIFSIWCGLGAGLFRFVAHDGYVPLRATAFLERHPELLGLRIYHTWGWGGYLGYRLSPPLRVFQDGRYIFHHLLSEAGAAAREPGSWQSFLDKNRIEAALLQNLPLKLPMDRRYPDGSRRTFQRPYYIRMMPKARWALVYWDRKALLFVRRGALPTGRLAELEYRLARPGDGEALQDVLRRGEIDRSRWETERKRHQRELANLPRANDP